MNTRITATLVAVIAIVTITSCELAPFAKSIQYFEKEVYLYEEALPEAASMAAPLSRAAGGRKKVTDFQYRFFNTARVMPVVVNGIQTQANDVLFVEDLIYVVYNTAGAEFAGALQVISIANPDRPRVIAEIALPDADVNAVAVEAGDIYIGGAWEPYADTFPEFDEVENDRAFIAKIAAADLATITAGDIADGKVILPGFAATGIAINSGVVFVSTGALNGEIALLDLDLTSYSLAPLTSPGDYRDVEAYRGGVVALQGTDQSGLTTGQVMTVGQDGSEKDALTITNFHSVEAKATLEVYDRSYGFLGLSDAGFQVVYLRDDDAVQSLYSIPNPTVEWSTRTQTNSASFSDDLIFTANGEAGFRAFVVTGELKRDTPPGPGFTSLVGFVPFDTTGPDAGGNYWSANHVEYQARTDWGGDQIGFLAVASGLGGVNLYRLTKR